MPQFIQQFSSFPWAAVLTAVVTVTTGVHVAALALGQKWPFFLKVASVSGALAVDVQKVAGWIGGAPVYTSIEAKKVGKAMVDDVKGPVVAPAVSALVALLLVACGHPEREACYANAEATAAHRAFTECPAKWSDCSAREAIMSELARTERSCQ